MATEEVTTDNTSAIVEELAEEKETGRIEAFSDGVFAIATTLLVLNIQVPALPNGDPLADAGALLNALFHQWPRYLAYFLGFSTIVIMWINHHGLFRLVRRSSHGLLVLNSLLLLVISIVPFPTALVAEYMSPLDSDRARLTLGIYSAWGIIIALCYNALWWYMSAQNRLINRSADPIDVRSVTLSFFFGPLFYVAALVAAIWSAPISLAINLLIALFFALPSRVQGSLAATVKRGRQDGKPEKSSSPSP
jgi:uncharacterized membrane protein